jgi:outer membrane protein assembly factor BamB
VDQELPLHLFQLILFSLRMTKQMSLEPRLILYGAAVSLVALTGAVHADWPMLRGDAQRTGFRSAGLRAPFRLAWARQFENERLGTAMEPIIGDGKLFVATHHGSLYALDAETGEPLWRFQAHAAFLQSPAYAAGLIVAGCADGNFYALDARSGKLRWMFYGGQGGFSASPAIADQKIFIGSRAGEFFGVALGTGKTLWRRNLTAPIRQSAAVGDGRVLVTPEDLRVRCCDAETGKLLWTSAPLAGQTARDYYPIIVKVGARAYAIVRTNPILNMGQRIARDRHLLAQNAGMDDSDWRKVEAWTRSDGAHGTPELWRKEQESISGYLKRNREARTFFVLDAATGDEAEIAPVLWVGGCQGVGAPPALTADGRLLVFYRSAYGNWNHGVAPLVALGLFELARPHPVSGEKREQDTGCRITPLFHQSGAQPPWNTFWGTADESQNFVIDGDLVLIVHQGTLSGFNLKTSQLFPILGERDTYGGFPNPPWARNEWHGPGRGGVALEGNRIYWITGSRVLCLRAGETGAPAAKAKRTEPTGIDGRSVRTEPAPQPIALTRRQLTNNLRKTVAEILSKSWAPLYTEPGLAGREFSFDCSAEWFEALSWAYPHLKGELKKKARAKLIEEWTRHRPVSNEAWYSLQDGARREYFWTPAEVCARAGQDKQPHPFGNLCAIWLYAGRYTEWNRVLAAWPELRASFDDFSRSGWRLDSAKGDPFANRYLASLLAFVKIAARTGDEETSSHAQKMADETTAALVGWWQRAAGDGTLRTFKGSGELDPFIGRGDALSLRIAPHRHKIALFADLTPEVAALVKAKAPEAVAAVWQTFQRLYVTWPLMGEERQVHSGENFVDPPDLALGAFKALAWLKDAPFGELAARVDLPFCRADLYYVTKLALALEAK